MVGGPHAQASDRVAVVTGGGTGIGRASALELAQAGFTVAICGRRPEPLDAVRHEIAASGGACLAEPCDVREPDQVEAFVGLVLDRYGRIDALVNNAGGQFPADAEDITVKGWRAVHRLAVEGAWSMTREVATQAMIPQRSGTVVFVGFSPRRGMPQAAHAASARAAVENLATGLALEWSRYGIRLCAIAPGQFDTEVFRTKYPAQVVETVPRTIPLRRLGRPEEMAWLIAYLASPAGDFFSGAVLTIDGARDNWFGSWPPVMQMGEAGEPPAEERR